MLRGEMDADDMLGNWYLRVKYYNNGGYISYTDVASGGEGSLNTTWTQKGGRFTTPSNANQVEVILYLIIGAGWAAWDDVSLNEVNDNLVYNLSYDAENHLTGVSGATSATFVYDGDGNRVKGTVNGTTVTYIGSHFEWAGSTSTMKKYYYAGGARVAMRTGTDNPKFLLTDHLGSTAIYANIDGSFNAEKRYMPWGEERWASGTMPTTVLYTGQHEQEVLGLYFYQSRWYDAALGRFIQADTLIPDPYNSQAYDRYAYVFNNPLRYVDSSGHLVCSDPNVADGDCSNEGVGLWRFGITIRDRDEWTSSDVEAVRGAAFAVGNKIASKIGGDPWKAFDETHADVELSMESSNDDGWHCERTGYGFTCYNATGELDSRVIVHEFAHVFNDTTENRGLGSPYDDLEAITIEDIEGNWVTGIDETGVWTRGFDGYRSEYAPDVYHGKEWKDWNSVNEEYADMYMNWVFDTFATNIAGDARYLWMDDQMDLWLPNYAR